MNLTWRELATTPMGWIHLFIIVLIIGYGWKNGAQLRRIVIEFNGNKEKP